MPLTTISTCHRLLPSPLLRSTCASEDAVCFPVMPGVSYCGELLDLQQVGELRHVSVRVNFVVRAQQLRLRRHACIPNPHRTLWTVQMGKLAFLMEDSNAVLDRPRP